MEPEALAARVEEILTRMESTVHATSVDLIAIKSELIDLARQTKEVVDFIALMQEIFTGMQDNPMLKAFMPSGMSMPKLPGM